MTPWVKVGEGEPPANLPVMVYGAVYDRTWVVCPGYREDAVSGSLWYQLWLDRPMMVTHWQYYPDAPEDLTLV